MNSCILAERSVSDHFYQSQRGSGNDLLPSQSHAHPGFISEGFTWESHFSETGSLYCRTQQPKSSESKRGTSCPWGSWTSSGLWSEFSCGMRVASRPHGVLGERKLIPSFPKYLPLLIFILNQEILQTHRKAQGILQDSHVSTAQM